MIRALWFMLVANVALLAGSQLPARWSGPPGPQEAPAAEPAREERRTRPIAVPVFGRGMVEGYLIVQFAYALASTAGNNALVESAIADATFRTFLGDPGLAATPVEKRDLGDVSRRVREAVNGALQAKVLSELLVVDVKFVKNDNARR